MGSIEPVSPDCSLYPRMNSTDAVPPRFHRARPCAIAKAC
jgi:hypothetical protein